MISYMHIIEDWKRLDWIVVIPVSKIKDEISYYLNGNENLGAMCEVFVISHKDRNIRGWWGIRAGQQEQGAWQGSWKMS
jgi:hypothetical protein